MGQDDTSVTDLQAKLDAARAARAEAEERRAKRFAAEDLTRELEKELRAVEELEELEELEAEHGRDGEKIWRLDTEMGMVVVGRPTVAKYRGFVDKGKTSQNAQEAFVREFLLYPSKERFSAMVGAMPALVGRCCDALVYLAGWREREEAAGKSRTS